MKKGDIVKLFDALRDCTLAYFEAQSEETEAKLKVVAMREKLKQARAEVNNLEI